MANTEGGTVVLGVRESADGAHIDGLDAAQVAAHQKTLWDLVNNRGKVSHNLLAPEHVAVVSVEAGTLLAIRIPRANRSQRPVYVGPTPFGHTYKRRHEGDYRCDDGEVRRMLADADPEPADQRLLPGFTLGDLDAPSLAACRRRLSAARPDHPWLSLPDEEFLERLGGWRTDRGASRAGLTLAGLLMFGREHLIRHVEAAPRYFVDYREKTDPSARWVDRIYPDGTWEANLFQFYGRVWPKLAAGLATPFRLEDGVRRDVTPAHEALREAFVNALVHADYSAAGGVVVERFADGFGIENPGTLLVSMEQYQRGGVSECRNPALQQMFLMIGGGEKAGSGADRIRSGWRAHHWRTPDLKLFDHPDRVRLDLPMVSLIPEVTLAHLTEQFGPDVQALGPVEVQALATAAIEGSVSNHRLQDLVSEHPVDITRRLQGLCARGWLVSDNRRRWTTYQLGGAAGSSSHKDSNSSHKVGSSRHNEPSSSRHNEGDSRHNAGPEATLAAIAAPFRSRKRLPPEDLRAVILRLCAVRFLTPAELAGLLDRDVANLVRRHLTPLVAEGRLTMRYPDNPNHPDQAYTATKTE